jgi:hypothetical protein
MNCSSQAGQAVFAEPVIAKVYVVIAAADRALQKVRHSGQSGRLFPSTSIG